jgi:restriction system protein
MPTVSKTKRNSEANLGFEAKLWQAADKLRNNMDEAEYKHVVLDLLHKMGYGTDRTDLQRVGGSGDGGIDGIIYLDKLGLEKVYVQAKRWQQNVGRPEIQAFYGALAGKHARKGIFITTSGFTNDAGTNLRPNRPRNGASS